MLPIHDHYALVSTKNVSASGATMILCRRAPSKTCRLGWPGTQTMFGH